VFAVYWTIARQREEEVAKVRTAVRTEVTTFVKYVIGALQVCVDVATGASDIPMRDASYIGKTLSTPTIYPAVADRIGLLPHPQATINFYMRIEETKAMLAAMANKGNYVPQSATNVTIPPTKVSPSNALSVADCLITALQCAYPIVADNDSAMSEMEKSVQTKTLEDMAAAFESARRIFPTAESFNTPARV